MLNSITYSEKIVSDFLRYQITTYPFAHACLDVTACATPVPGNLFAGVDEMHGKKMRRP